MLLVRYAARDHDVGPEAVCGQRAVQPRVQVVERNVGKQQEREVVGKADPVCGAGVERIHGSFGLVGHVDQATCRAGEFRKPEIRVPPHETTPTLSPPSPPTTPCASCPLGDLGCYEKNVNNVKRFRNQ
jgi:hypothetical protein